MHARRWPELVLAITIGLCICQTLPRAHADVQISSCEAADCLWLVAGDSVVAKRSLTLSQRAAREPIVLSLPRTLEGPHPGRGVGLLNAEDGELDGFVYLDRSGRSVVFQPGSEIPAGVSLMKSVPELGEPQVIFTLPTADGALTRIYIQSGVPKVPEPSGYAVFMTGVLVALLRLTRGARVALGRRKEPNSAELDRSSRRKQSGAVSVM